MKKCIYKITNLINNKIYIGQTNDYERRVREHKNKMYGNVQKPLYKAIDEYGIENFTFEIIENYCEDYNEKEHYWIKYYNSDEKDRGYNIDLTSIEHGDIISLSNEELEAIYKNLEENKLSIAEIANKFNFKSEQSIRKINKGINYYDSAKSYPIRKLRNELAYDRAILIIKDLKETLENFDSLAKKYNCSVTCISNINTGDRCKMDNESYPIRTKTRKGNFFTEEDINNIYMDILNTTLKWTELAEKYDCNIKVFQHINQGQLHRKDGYNYPLRAEQNRKGSEKVLQIIKDLKNPNLLIKDIAVKNNCCSATVSKINKGLVHKQSNIEYPIRKCK